MCLVGIYLFISRPKHIHKLGTLTIGTSEVVKSYLSIFHEFQRVTILTPSPLIAVSQLLHLRTNNKLIFPIFGQLKESMYLGLQETAHGHSTLRLGELLKMPIADRGATCNVYGVYDDYCACDYSS